VTSELVRAANDATAYDRRAAVVDVTTGPSCPRTAAGAHAQRPSTVPRAVSPQWTLPDRGEYLSRRRSPRHPGLILAYCYDVLWVSVGYMRGKIWSAGRPEAAPLRRSGSYTLQDSPRSGCVRVVGAGLASLLVGLIVALPRAAAARGRALTLRTPTARRWLGRPGRGGRSVLAPCDRRRVRSLRAGFPDC